MDPFDEISIDDIKKKETLKINLNCIILICYLLSIFSNIVFFFIFSLSKYLFKWVGFIFIITELVLLKMSLDKIIRLRERNFVYFKKISYILMLSLILNFLFLFVVIIYIIAKGIDTELIFLIITSFLIWGVFHGLFISILKYYIEHKQFKEPKPQPKPEYNGNI